MENPSNFTEFVNEKPSDYNPDKFLKSVEPSAVDPKELDIVLKEMFRWVVEKSYVPTSQETRISLTYNFIPFGSGITSAYLSSLALKRLGVPKYLVTVPVALIGLSAVASTARFSRKAVNYKLIQLGTPMGQQMIHIIQDYRANPSNYEELAKTDMLTFRKYIQEAYRKRREAQSQASSSSSETNLTSNLTMERSTIDDIPNSPYSYSDSEHFNTTHFDDHTLPSTDFQPMKENENFLDPWSPEKSLSFDEPSLSFGDFPQDHSWNREILDNHESGIMDKSKKYKTWEEIRQQTSS